MVTRLCLDFIHLDEHKFWHNFRNTVSAMCDCGSELESTQHIPLRYPIFNYKRKLFEILHDIKPSIFKFQKDFQMYCYLVSVNFEETISRKILKSRVPYLKSSSFFKQPLIDQWWPFCYSEQGTENSAILFGFFMLPLNCNNSMMLFTCMQKIYVPFS